jgi:hypothetical protein
VEENKRVEQIDRYLKGSAEIIKGKEAMFSYIDRETGEGRCPVCIARRVMRFASALKGPYSRGKRLACLATIRTKEHTCKEKKNE